MELEIAAVSQEQLKLAEQLKEVSNILSNKAVTNADSLKYIKKPINHLLSKLKYLPMEPSFNILPLEMKTKILGYLSPNEALRAASVCQEWNNILQDKIPPISNTETVQTSKGNTRFCYKRFVLDLMGMLLLCLWRVYTDDPVQHRNNIAYIELMLLLFFYWVEKKYKDAPLTAVIQTTILVLQWGISWYLVAQSRVDPSSPRWSSMEDGPALVQIVAVPLYSVGSILFVIDLAILHYPPSHYTESTKLPFSKQSFFSTTFWYISLYLVAVYEYPPAAVLIVATFSIPFFSMLARNIITDILTPL